MANKIDAKLILELLQTPMSQRKIIKTRHISSKSITAVQKEPRQDAPPFSRFPPPFRSAPFRWKP